MLLKFLYDSVRAFILFFFFSSHFNFSIFLLPLEPVTNSTYILSKNCTILFFPLLPKWFVFVYDVIFFDINLLTNQQCACFCNVLKPEKFLTRIHLSILFTSFTYFVIKVMSLRRRIGTASFAPSCVISIRRW